jgi:NADPH:quinone reductase-like Zn-dependent oxidoreductase
MKAIVLHEYGGPENLKYEDVPDPVPAEDAVLVRIAATSINPVDYKMRSGEAKARFPVEFPAILGRDVSGVVRAVGAKVTGFVPGDKVIGLGWRTYAELTILKASLLTHVPDGLALVEAAALPLVTLTGEQLVSRGTKIQAGQTLLVTGALGNVGRTAVYAAKKAGAIVIAGVRKNQVKEAEALGAERILALDDDEAMKSLGFVDAVADTVNHETAQQLLGKVKPGGVFASVLGPPANAKLHPTVHIEAVVCVPDPAALRVLAEDALAGKFKIPIDRILPLAEAAEGQKAAEKGGIGKVLLVP